jgi:sigma-E factor negative regulatory protein RseA
MATKEQISALVDNQIDDISLLVQVGDDPEAQSLWERYHLVGDVMRGEVPALLHMDISAKVAQALENEPAILAPGRDVGKGGYVKAKVIHWMRTGGQYAIAASVTIATIVGVQQYQSNDDPYAAPTTVLNTVPITGSAAPVSLQTGNMSKKQEELTEEQWAEQRKRVAAYLQDHRLQQRTAN